MTAKAAVTVVREWEILCSWIHMMYTDCRQDLQKSVEQAFTGISGTGSDRWKYPSASSDDRS